MKLTPPAYFILHVAALVFLSLLGWENSRPRPESVPLENNELKARDGTGPSETSEFDKPHFAFLWARHFLVPGQTMVAQGLVRGMNRSGPLQLSLSGPDGTVTNVELRAAPGGEASFSIEHPTSAAATGLFTWEVRLRSVGTPVLLGAEVREPHLPRVLILQDHPAVEGGRLERWLAASGASVSTRTRISAEHYRVSAANGSPDQLPQLDLPSLSHFDILVAHESALARLTPAERQALRMAIREQGRGLLVIGPIDPEGSNSGLDLLRVRPSPAIDPAEQSRPARIQLSHAPYAPASSSRALAMNADSEPFLSVLAGEMEMPPTAQVLARDVQGRAVACVVQVGQGRVARSLVLDSWRWRQHGMPQTYANFWSTLFSAIARPLPLPDGTWSMESPSLPVVVDEPVGLFCHVPVDASLPRAEVRGLADEEARTTGIVLNLTRDPITPSRARTVYWPVHPGWHEVRLTPDSPGLSFHVQARDALPGVIAERQREMAARNPKASDTDEAQSTVSPETAHASHFTTAVWFLLFLLSAMGIWLSEVCRNGLVTRTPP